MLRTSAGTTNLGIVVAGPRGGGGWGWFELWPPKTLMGSDTIKLACAHSLARNLIGRQPRSPRYTLNLYTSFTCASIYPLLTSRQILGEKNAPPPPKKKKRKKEKNPTESDTQLRNTHTRARAHAGKHKQTQAWRSFIKVQWNKTMVQATPQTFDSPKAATLRPRTTRDLQAYQNEPWCGSIS